MNAPPEVHAQNIAPAIVDLNDDRAFMTVVEAIPGWLDRYAALRSIDLLHAQERAGTTGPVYEVGLYQGKYFAILLRSAMFTHDRAVGIDTFEHVSPHEFEREFEQHIRRESLLRLGQPNIRFLAGRSTQWDAGALLSELGNAPRFISIDGSHEHDDVYWDLCVAERTLGPKGIIAVDDYLNPLCLGVNEAINRFLITTSSVVPFAYVANKLFLTRPACVDEYRLELERCIMSDEIEPRSIAFRNSIDTGGRHHVEPVLFGRKVISIPYWPLQSATPAAATQSGATSMTIRVVEDTTVLPYNRAVFGDRGGIIPTEQPDRFTQWWAWAGQNGLNTAEYLMPQLCVATRIEPFSFEQRFVVDRIPPPSREQIDQLAPWVYQVEMGSISTRSTRDRADWHYHRYRNSLLVDTVVAIAGDRAPELSVLDVGSHCGVFSLEFAERGFGSVTGLDLRSDNVNQARFLADVYRVNNVTFQQVNARDITRGAPADIVFCGGLLYHVTFPMDLLRDLYAMTNEFLVLDSICHNYALSAFHLVCGKNVNYSAEGELHYEFQPTYRALCDGLYAVGFNTIYEIIGDLASEVPHYATGNVRSFVAAKTDRSLLGSFVQSLRG